jgi:positive regulator of sigma E activity
MTCGGFTKGILQGCSMAWIAPVIIFFLIIFARKYLGEEAGVPFSMIGACLGGFGAYLIIITFTCSYKLALVGGLAGVVVLGIFLSSFFEGIGG